VTFATLGVDTEKLETIGWSKAKELARIPAEQLKKDYDKLVKLAEEKTRDELTSHITKKYTVATRGQSIKTTSFGFRFAEADGETVTQALERAKPMAGENADANAALLYIANDFLTGGQGSDMTLAQMVELIQNEFGVEVTLTADGETVDAATYTPTAENDSSETETTESELVPA
jgi:nucleotidyltransferase/DNA polymerase involved in DNA repair